MSSKKLKYFTDLGDQLNREDKESHDDTQFMPPSEKKFHFFWNRCMPLDAEVSSSVFTARFRAKRQQMNSRRRWLVASVSIAASVMLLTSLFFIREYCTHTQVMDDAAVLAQVSLNGVRQITLVTPSGRVPLYNNACVSYDPDGSVHAGSMVISAASCAHEYNQLLVPAGKRARVLLADGTMMVVNSCSKVIFPRRFFGRYRKILADGEVFMDVAHDGHHPFVVGSSDFSLRVLGTKFNVSTYNHRETVVLVRGCVEVTDHQSRKARMLPNDLLTMNSGTIIRQQKVDISSYISWADGMLVLDDLDMSTIASRLSNYYGMPISCSATIANRQLYGKLNLSESLDSVLTCLQQVIAMKIQKTNTGIVFK